MSPRGGGRGGAEDRASEGGAVYPWQWRGWVFESGVGGEKGKKGGREGREPGDPALASSFPLL